MSEKVLLRVYACEKNTLLEILAGLGVKEMWPRNISQGPLVTSSWKGHKGRAAVPPRHPSPQADDD